VEWSLDGSLPKVCPVIPTSNQDGRQAKNTKMGKSLVAISPVEDLYVNFPKGPMLS
jgi:hypothetical protein